MSIGPITVRCASCDTRLLLSEALLGRLNGQAGRISCKRCAAKIRVDLRHVRPEFTGASVESGDARSAVAVTQLSSLPPPSPEQALLAGSAALAPPRLPMSTLDAFTVDGGRRSSVPPPLPSDAPEHRASMRPRAPSITPLPPRPGAPSLAPPPPSKSLFDELPGGPLSLPPPTLQVTEDGRLLNDADLGRAPRRSPRVAPWLLAAAATFAVAGGAAATLGVPRVLPQAAVVPQVSGVAIAATRSASGAAAPAPILAPIQTTLVQEEDLATVAAEPVGDSGASETVEPSSLERASARAASTESSESSGEATEGASGERGTSSGAETGAEASGSAESAVAGDEPPAEPPPFDKSAAGTALNEATAHATQCRSSSDPSGTALVVVTFAPSGRVTSATISGPPFAGTPVGGCIAGRFRGARVPAFTGEMVTVSKTVVLR